MFKWRTVTSKLFLALILATIIHSCKNSMQNNNASFSDSITYFTDNESCTCRTYEGMKPPPLPPDNPDLSDSILTGNKHKKYMLHASIVKCVETDLIRGNNYEVFQLEAWDYTNKLDVRIVHPMPVICYLTLELYRDIHNDKILIGYKSENKFYSYYDLHVNDTFFEAIMNKDALLAKDIVCGNIYLEYKKRIRLLNK